MTFQNCNFGNINGNNLIEIEKLKFINLSLETVHRHVIKWLNVPVTMSMGPSTNATVKPVVMPLKKYSA